MSWSWSNRPPTRKQDRKFAQGSATGLATQPAQTLQAGADGTSPTSAEALKDFEPSHLEKLKQGRVVWNAWVAEQRKVDMQFKPRLEGIDFTDAKQFSGAAIWGRWKTGTLGAEGVLLNSFDLSNAILEDANLTGASLYLANLSDAWAPRVNMSGAYLLEADLSRAYVFGANFSRAHLSHASLNGAHLGGANLTRAGLIGTDLRGAEVLEANLSGANLRSSRWGGAYVAGIIYNRIKLAQLCLGIDADGMYGDAQFKRDVQDQDFIDTQWEHSRRRSPIVRVRERDGEPPRLSISWFQTLRAMSACLSEGFLSVSPILTAVFFLALVWLVAPKAIGTLVTMPTPLSTDVLAAWVDRAAPALWALGLGLLAGGILNTWYGRWLQLLAWHLFGYGREWGRVVLFASLMIALFGTLYAIFSPEHVVISQRLCAPDQDTCDAFKPWFVAALAFATLGISDLVTPQTGLGEVLMLGNVLSGFVTLGLLLAVLADQFSRRS